MARSNRLRCAVLLLTLLPLTLAAQAFDGPDGAPDAPSDPAAIIAGPLPAADGEARIPLEEIRRYVGVYRTVRDAYVDEVSDAERNRPPHPNYSAAARFGLMGAPWAMWSEQ